MVRGREKSSPYIQKRTKIFCNVPKSIYICNQNDKSDGKIRSFVYDRLTSFDLVKSGKFTLGCRNGLVKSVMFLSRDTDCFSIICLTSGIFQNLTRASVAKVRACPFLYRPDKPNLITIKTLTAYAKIQNHNQTTEDEQRHHHRTRHVRRGLIH